MSGVGSRMISGTPSRFFSLPSAGAFGSEVGDGGGHHDDVGVIGEAVDGCLHLGGRLDVLDHDPGRRREVDGRNERHRRTARRRLGGDGVALLAGTAVGDHADRVDRFAGAAGTHDERARPRDRDGPSTRSAVATMSAGDARRPVPTSPPARRPVAGSTM